MATQSHAFSMNELTIPIFCEIDNELNHELQMMVGVTFRLTISKTNFITSTITTPWKLGTVTTAEYRPIAPSLTMKLTKTKQGFSLWTT